MDVEPEQKILTPAQALHKQELLEALEASTQQLRAWRQERRQLREELKELMAPKEKRCKDLTEMLDAQSSKHVEIITELKSLS